jgi:hypothetical protein
MLAAQRALMRFSSSRIWSNVGLHSTAQHTTAHHSKAQLFGVDHPSAGYADSAQPKGLSATFPGPAVFTIHMCLACNSSSKYNTLT